MKFLIVGIGVRRQFCLALGVTALYFLIFPGKKLILSTIRRDNKIDEETGSARKPECVTFYNATKRGVDTVDQMSSL